ncbi:glycoside hydrolase family 5 protein [Aaosphaeria arxii CBS 175.79]|uniref:cellulase n=1 Tax=Aaosphaeria arxii CBS 175.79 TaxID=1450172 RepID=A0A6A5XBS1_9PLEO|nr:glycoside hydrolase family 5 protein [Aaosphaeria arxii CBS 175.79]KAF2010296.1 glycoside hydrolase family 5 protein [Aaosphaeria arxii CBS 175.79]
MLFSRAASLVLAALQTVPSAAEIIFAGVNSAGGEFAQQILPGAFGTDYRFINESAIDFFLNAGVNTIRVTFLLERMCPLETGLGSTFNETYFGEFEKAVNYITMQGAYAVLDAHNYMRYNDPSMQPQSGSIIGDSSDPQAATAEDLAEFWSELSTRFLSNPNVIFGIMNEPHDMPTELVLANDQAVINAIRSAGAQQLILVPGNGFAGAQRWLNETCDQGCTPNAEVMTAIQDPENNFAFDMHLYFDNDTSGTHEECTLAAPNNLIPVTNWLAENNYTAFLSEFGAGSTPTCSETLNNTINWMEDHSQFIGWTYWAAGPLWGDYFLSVEPGVGPQANTTWPEVLEPHIRSYQPMQRCGVSSSGTNGVFDGAIKALEGCLGLRLPA